MIGPQSEMGVNSKPKWFDTDFYTEVTAIINDDFLDEGGGGGVLRPITPSLCIDYRSDNSYLMHSL